VHQVIVDSINRTDLDLRKSLFSNIVLSGGSTLCTGTLNLGQLSVQELMVRLRRSLTERSEKAGAQGRQAEDLRSARAEGEQLTPVILYPADAQYSTWIGGSILAGLSTFKKVS